MRQYKNSNKPNTLSLVNSNKSNISSVISIDAEPAINILIFMNKY